MKPRLVLAGLGHGQLEITKQLARLERRYEVVYIGTGTSIYTGAFPQTLAGVMPSAIVYLPKGLNPMATTVRGVDPVKQSVMTENGDVPYDVLVLATGARSRGIGVPLKPMRAETISRIQESSAVTIVGGGKAGVELAFVCSRRQHVTLYAPKLLFDQTPWIQRKLERTLVKAGVTVVKQRYVEGGDGLVLDATGVVPEAWWAESGLTEQGAFIPTDDTLRHPKFPTIYVTGDMAARLNGGVDAVRSGRHVANSLLDAPSPFQSRTALNILLTTPGKALLTFGRFAWHGRIPYWMKRWIDTRYMRRFRK